MQTLKLLILSLISTFVFAESSTTENISKNTKEFPINGTWQMISFQLDGEFSSDEEVRKWKVKNDGNKFIVYYKNSYHSEGILNARITENTKLTKHTKLPNYVGEEDSKYIDGPWVGTNHLGIFSTFGDILVSCYVTDDKKRPESFTSEKGSGNRLAIYKKVKSPKK